MVAGVRALVGRTVVGAVELVFVAERVRVVGDVGGLQRERDRVLRHQLGGGDIAAGIGTVLGAERVAVVAPQRRDVGLCGAGQAVVDGAGSGKRAAELDHRILHHDAVRQRQHLVADLPEVQFDLLLLGVANRAQAVVAAVVQRARRGVKGRHRGDQQRRQAECQ